MVVRALAPGLVDDFLGFFDRVYENDPWLNSKNNPWWSGCYCGFFDTKKRDSEQNKIPPEERRRTRALRITQGLANGFLAYQDNEVVGWINAGPRSGYVSLQHMSEAVDNPNERIGSVVCFVVDYQHRRMGVATALLNAACDQFKRSRLEFAEAYPRNRPANVDNPYDIPEEHLNYYGPMQMYLKAGFEIHKQFPKFDVVRKALLV